MTAEDVQTSLEQYINPEKAAFFPRFFRTGPGEYGEGDKFIGVTVPNQRKVATQYKQLSLDEIQILLDSPIHEHRLTGLLILTLQFPKADESDRHVIYKFYLRNAKRGRVNNWDLVDSSAPKIVGAYLLDKDRAVLRQLYDTNELWQQRIAILACYTFIKQGQFDDILELAEMSLDHSHDLIHKAAGWMLRELGKQDELVLRTFLDQHATHMPRTMLRYSIERLPKQDRQSYLAQ